MPLRLNSDETHEPVESRSYLYFLLILTILAPLPFGSDRPVAWSFLGLSIGAVLVLYLRRSGNSVHLPQYLIPSAALFLLVLAFGLLQTSPITPNAWHNPIWMEASTALSRRLVGSISVDQHRTLVGVFRLSTYGAFFFLAYLLSLRRSNARLAVRVIACVGGSYAMYGLAAYFSGNKTILWFHKWAYLTDLTGTFVNRNSFATYLGICLLATLCDLTIAIQDTDFSGPWRDRARLSVEFGSRYFWLFLCCFLEASALLLTHSRGGNFAAIAGISVYIFSLALAPSIRRQKYWGGVAAIFIAIAAIAFAASGTGVIGRALHVSSDLQGRVGIYRDILPAISDHPMLGSGLGSFTSVFPQYRTEDVGLGFINAAHNDYLQDALELGVPVALALVGSVSLLVYECIHGIWIRNRDAAFPCMGVAVSALVGLHAMVDFSLQIPAVALTYTFLVAVAVAHSRSPLPSR